MEPASTRTDLGAYRNDGHDQEPVEQHRTAALQTKGRAIAPPGAMPGATSMNDRRPGRTDLDGSPGEAGAYERM